MQNIAVAPGNSRPLAPIKLYRHVLSGHCHRVELFLSLLDLPVQIIEVDFAKMEQKSAAFLALNSFGQVPVIQDGAVTLADANAILVYLAQRYAPDTWLPHDPLAAAQVQRWLSVAAGLLAFGPATARLSVLFKKPIHHDEVMQRASDLLALIEQTLQTSPYLAGPMPTLADIANYSYIARAPEGNVSLQPYPQIRAWLLKIEALPRFKPMLAAPAALAA